VLHTWREFSHLFEGELLGCVVGCVSIWHRLCRPLAATGPFSPKAVSRPNGSLPGCPLYVHIDGPRTMGLFVLVISVASSNYFVAQRMDAAEVPCRGERPYPVEAV
jgi:hypothetical protein